MPEIKHQFTGGKMNKDLDERLVPNGEYRDAMNIQVATSDGSDVGTAQNILGNIEIPITYVGKSGQPQVFVLPTVAEVIGSISDEKIDTMYYLVWTKSADYILSWRRGDDAIKFVFIDNSKSVLKFDKTKIITGINVIDDMLFWTDNINEPRKINIQRCKDGTFSMQQTKLISAENPYVNTGHLVEEKHITVIKKAPQIAPDIKLHAARAINKLYTAIITTSSPSNPLESDFVGLSASDGMYDFSSISTDEGSNEFYVQIKTALDSSNNEVTLSQTVTGGSVQPGSAIADMSGWLVGLSSLWGLIDKTVVLQAYDEDGTPPGLPLTDFAIKGQIFWIGPSGGAGNYNAEDYSWIGIRVTTVDGFPTQADPQETLKYVIDAFDEEERLFEFKYPRFSYRYKFEDGEYSPFAPFTQVAFIPGSFDYHPRKGYNVGMTNKLKEVELSNFVTEDTPRDVVAIDVLFKDDSSPSVYVVDTIRPNDYRIPGGTNLWDDMISENAGFFIKKEAISSITPSNQLLRPWDNVPKKALAQDVTGNRIVYANYVQNYDLTSQTGEKYVPQFSVTNASGVVDTVSFIDPSTNVSASAYKSIKSLREYQLGVVFIDDYGRETPVISNATGTRRFNKAEAATANRLGVQFNSDDFPQSLNNFKFFVKETSSEYYNMAMDRWYSAGDGNIWLAFPSSDRNKIDIDTFLVLKKGSDQDTLVEAAARYKVLAIESEAPDFIKTSKRKAVAIKHALGNTATDVFGSNSQHYPFEGRDDFKMIYQAFHGTSGQDLAILEDELWFEFGKVGTDEVSKRYKVDSITNSYPGGGVAVTAADVFSVKLQEPLGSDVNFISDDLSGVSPNIIENGAIVNVYRYKVENLDRFDGRFFVKIYFDEVFRTNIEKTVIGGGVRVGASKMVYSMDDNLIAKHTSDLDHFATRKYGNTRAGQQSNWNPSQGKFVGFSNQLSTWINSFNNPINDPGQMLYGYYAIDEFTANALYFRKYREKEYTENGTTSSPPDYGVPQLQPYQNVTSVINSLNNGTNILGMSPPGGCRALVHLINKGSNSTPNYDGSAPVQYKGINWADAPGWEKEFGYHQSDKQSYARQQNSLTSGTRGITSMWERGSTNITLSLNTWYVENVYGYSSDNKSVRDTEVWFIDKGPYIAQSNQPDGKLVWNGQNTFQGTFSGNIVSAPAYGSGLVTQSSSWNMQLGFGGVQADSTFNGLSDIVGFWNVGDWNNIGNTLNNGYTDVSTTSFVNYLGAGYRFRWKEDPDLSNEYTINGLVTEKSIIRHSDGPNLGGSNYSFLQSLDNESTKQLENNATGRYKDLRSMAENLSFNMSKRWKIDNVQPELAWNPATTGVIPSGHDLSLEVVNSIGDFDDSTPRVTGATATALSNKDDLKIFVRAISVIDVNTSNPVTLHVGMGLISYTNLAGVLTSVNSPVKYIVRDIQKLSAQNGVDDYFELTLGGYLEPLTLSNHQILVLGNLQPTALSGNTYRFMQVGMNGYSPNSEFNINTIGRDAGYGAIAAVGYTLEFIEDIQETEVLSENPAIWETEPKDSTPLDIYYEACGSIPTRINAETISSALPISTKLRDSGGEVFEVVDYDGGKLIVINTNNPVNAPISGAAVFNRPDDLVVSMLILPNINAVGGAWAMEVESDLVDKKFTLPWHNCYSFGNGVESNRIRDNFNAPYISNGVKASTTLEQEYKEEHRKYGLIYSGIYNSTSGVNNLNQFIQAEKITKDVNPIYGSIQKLYSRDSDLVTLCEDKILRIQANKDALFNADGDSNVVATNKVLGQTIPFAGEHGISQNPESFASESYRAYFTDRVRGAVMRLSKDGLTPISDAGMKDWFRDNLKHYNKLIGSYDDRNNEYNITLKKLDIGYPIRIIGTGLGRTNNN